MLRMVFCTWELMRGGKRTTISYTTHMEKLPKESWDLSRPCRDGFIVGRVLKL